MIFRKIYLSKKNCFSVIFFSFFVIKVVAQDSAITANSNNSGLQAKFIDLSKPIGETRGSMNITQTGGISYAVPIFVSPGTNTIQPSLALVYNSQSPEGLAGIGWNLSGLSIISRTGRNMYHNGSVKALDYTSNDAFLIDGVKLNTVGEGINGANGTTYALETENFSKIVSNTSGSNNNPDWFQVTNNNGSVAEYGRTLDSKMITDDGLNVIL